MKFGPLESKTSDEMFREIRVTPVHAGRHSQPFQGPGYSGAIRGLDH